jgi:transposase
MEYIAFGAHKHYTLASVARMVLVRQRTQLKNRIHAALANYALHDLEGSDLFGVRGRDLLRQRLDLLPPHTGYATQQLLEQVEELDRRVRGFEQRMRTVCRPTTAKIWLRRNGSMIPATTTA